MKRKSPYAVTPAQKRAMKANAAKARAAKLAKRAARAQRGSLESGINPNAGAMGAGNASLGHPEPEKRRYEEYLRARRAGKIDGFADGLREGLRALQCAQETLLNAALRGTER